MVGTRDKLRSKQIDAYVRQRVQRTLVNRSFKDRPWRYRHRPEDDWYTEDYSDFKRNQWYQVTPKASPSQRLKEQWERGSPYRQPPRLSPRWDYKPRPREREEDKPKPLPPFEFPDLDDPGLPELEKPTWEPPFEPDEGPEDTGDEDMADDPREGRLPDPLIPLRTDPPDCANTPEQAALLGIPLCHKTNAQFQIRTSKTKFRKKSTHGQAYHKSRYRYYPF